MEGSDISISKARQRINAIAADDPQRLSLLNTIASELGQHHLNLYWQALDELDEAIRVFREVARAAPHDDPDLPTYLSNLGHALGTRFTVTNARVHLEETIGTLRHAFQITSEYHSIRPVIANNLAMRLGQRHDQNQELADLDEAIAMSRIAVVGTPKDDPDRVRRLHNFGTSLNKRYLLSKSPEDLNDAIDHLREAVDISPPGDHNRGQWFTNLGDSMTERYELTGDDEHLEEAIQMLRKGLQASPEGHQLRPIWLTNLGLRLVDRYKRSGNLADLDEAIEFARSSLLHTPKDDPQQSKRLMSLAVRLSMKHEHTGAIKYLDEAIAINQQAVFETPPNSPDRPGYLNNLGQNYVGRYLRSSARTDLEQAIEILRQAVAASQPGKPHHAACLSNLANSLARLWNRTRSPSSSVLTEAVQISQQAVDATLPEHPAMAERLSNLSLRLRDKFRCNPDDETYIEDAIRTAQKAIAAVLPEHPIKAACLNTAGYCYLSRYRAFSRIQDLEEAKFYFRSSLKALNSQVSVRLQAGRELLAFPHSPHDPQVYAEAMSVIDLIPLLAPRSLQDTDKQHLLVDVVGMASDAAAIALNSGKGAEAAIRCLEKGRGIIAGAALEQRQISKLTGEHQDLGLSFTTLRNSLDRPAMQDVGSSIRPEAEDIDPTALVEMEQNARHEAEQRLTELLKRIRTVDGFGQFLEPASGAEMRNAARFGPIVLLNVSFHRCDALIIEQAQIRSIALQNVSEQVIDDYALRLEDVDTLEWLWDRIVSPVLNVLGYTTSVDAKVAPITECTLRRIWWIPTGKLSKFPLHAAGYHLDRGGETTLDRVVSSYSSSVRAIIQERRAANQAHELASHPVMDLVAVSMKETPGFTSLQYAEVEVEEVLFTVKADKLQHKRPRPCKKEVLASMERCKIFHFAGHGSSHPTDPLKSTLLLEDWEQDPLTVESLLKADFGAKPPFLAYLSACGTGQIRDDGSIDESIHLAHAWQLAGVRHVVGTLWNVEDFFCVPIAKMTYAHLQSHEFQDESVSRGLHEALRMHRDEWVDEVDKLRRVHKMDQQTFRGTRKAVLDHSPSLRSPAWVPYVHFGI